MSNYSVNYSVDTTLKYIHSINAVERHGVKTLEINVTPLITAVFNESSVIQ